MNNQNTICICLLISVLCNYSYGQDTLTIMHYNILNYGNYTHYCQRIDNPVPNKNAYIKTIVSHIKPTIFSVNEMSNKEKFQDSLLNKGLNIEDVNYYKKAPVTNISGASLVNVLYYDSRKVAFHSVSVAQTYVRDISIYSMYHKGNRLQQGDTTFFTCVLAHLKAGNSNADIEDRTLMVSNTMYWISQHKKLSNYLLMGDLNVSNHTEGACEQLFFNIDETIRFYDPVEQIGHWNENADYALYHTQSTHSENNTPCFAGSGLDDRFDFILVDKTVLRGSNGVKYINNSYSTIGNDGLHFNNSILENDNASVPEEVAEALYYNSDHLPIVMQLAIYDSPLSCITTMKHKGFSVHLIKNPVHSNLQFYVQDHFPQNYIAKIISIKGIEIYSNQFISTQKEQTFSVAHLPTGMYFLQILSNKEIITTKFLVKK